MKWRLVVIMAALLAVIWFLPTEWWWAKMVLICTIGGVFIERRRARIQEEYHYKGLGMPDLLLFSVFALGIVWSSFKGFQWWPSLGVGLISVLAFVLAIWTSNRVVKEIYRRRHS